MPTQKINKTAEIINKIFKDPSVVFGLKEFEQINLEEVLTITEEEKNRYFLKDLKTGKFRLVYDEEKNITRPEEIVRQLWPGRAPIYLKKSSS